MTYVRWHINRVKPGKGKRRPREAQKGCKGRGTHVVGEHKGGDEGGYKGGNECGDEGRKTSEQNTFCLQSP